MGHVAVGVILGYVFSEILQPSRVGVEVESALRGNPLEGTYFKKAFGGPCPNRRCIIPENHGGDEHVFMLAAWEVLEGYADEVTINGKCASGCVLFAELARSKVRLSPKAKMYVHQGSMKLPILASRLSLVIYKDPSHSSDFTMLIEKEGGFPHDELHELSESTLRAIWPTSKTAAAR